VEPALSRSTTGSSSTVPAGLSPPAASRISGSWVCAASRTASWWRRAPTSTKMPRPAAAESEFAPIVRRLGCLRGVSTLTGFALAVEIGDWHRFTGNAIGSFVGLVPSEYSSGASRVQGSITKTGNTHVRRLLVEAAWHHRARYVVQQRVNPSQLLGQPQHLLGQHRLPQAHLGRPRP
jgi:hypothetical protein